MQPLHSELIMTDEAHWFVDEQILKVKTTAKFHNFARQKGQSFTDPSITSSFLGQEPLDLPTLLQAEFCMITSVFVQ